MLYDDDTVQSNLFPMAQISSNLVERPFAEVDAWRQSDGTIRVKATILKKPDVENAQTGLAIDASRSMAPLFGTPDSVFFSGTPNLVEPVARKIAEYLANFDSDGETTAIYYACGKFGAQIQFVGEIDAERSRTVKFDKPKDMGTGTQIVPAINFFMEHFQDTPWLICLFITDGLIDDLEQAKAASKKICEEMAAGTRGFTKFVIIGLGSEFSDASSAASVALEELDDLDDDPVYGVEGQDLWDHKIAKDMQSLDEIFAEVVDDNAVLCLGARVTDSNGADVVSEDGRSYSDGLPALLRFVMPADSDSFTLHLPNGMEITQDISSVL